MKDLSGAAEILSSSRALVVLTGAGISAESGVPTFRGAEGYWRNYRPEDLATPEAFSRDPALVWEWYSMRREALSRVKPNPGHLAIAEMEDLVEDFTLITQNVDGLHHLGGSRKVLELHGNIWRVRCTVCGMREMRKEPFETLPPHCGCGGLLRPDVVWFGEMLPQEVLEEAYDALGRCEAILVVGTSGIVQPAASFPFIAKGKGARVVEVNPEETTITSVADVSIRERAGKALPAIVRIWKKNIA